jgi:hypothetical protein
MDPAASAALYSTHVLKDGDSFLVANGYGDIDEGSTGFFQDDTRLLSVLRLRLGDTQPACSAPRSPRTTCSSART